MTTPGSVHLSYTQHLPKAYVSRTSKVLLACMLLPVSISIVRFLALDGDPIGLLLPFLMFGGFAWIAIARLRSHTLTALINDVGIDVRFTDGTGGPAQLFRWDEIGSIVVRPIDIKREFGRPGPHLDYRVSLFKGPRLRGRKFSYVCDGTEAMELRTRDGRIAIITVSDGDAVREVLKTLGHPAS